MRDAAWSKGYTLVELLVAMGFMTALMAWAAPSLTGVVYASRVRAGADALNHSLSLARSEAVKRNTHVIMCRSVDGRLCSAQAGWEQGWIVFPDANGDGQPESQAQILHYEERAAEGLRILGNWPVGHYVSYTPYGRTRLLSGAFQAGTFTVCSEGRAGVKARQVVINSVGRARVAQAPVSACA